MAKSSVALNIAPILTLAVIGLAVAKLAGWLAITWWIVFSPWLIVLALWVAVLGFAIVVGGTAAIIAIICGKKL